MEEQTRRQVQGTVELLRDTVQAGASSIGAAHQEIAATPYRVLQYVPLVSRPAAAVGRMQREITHLTYSALGAIVVVVAAAATRLLHTGAAEQSGRESAQG